MHTDTQHSSLNEALVTAFTQEGVGEKGMNFRIRQV